MTPQRIPRGRWKFCTLRGAIVPVPVLRPVEVVQEPASSQDLALIAPGGVRVEGLGVQEAAQLLRLLA